MEPLLIFPFTPLPFLPLFLHHERLIGAYILLLLAWEFAATGIGYTLQFRNNRRQCTASTTATITDNVERTMRSLSERHGYIPTYHPVVDYYVNGTLYHIICNDGQPRPMQQGLVVTIYYNPHKPEEFQFEENQKTFTEKYVWLVFLGFSTIMLFGAYLFCVVLY